MRLLKRLIDFLFKRKPKRLLTAKEELLEELRVMEGGRWAYTADVLADVISETTFTPPGDPCLTQKDYLAIQGIEAVLTRLGHDMSSLYARCPDDVEILDEHRYDELLRFIAEAGNRVKGARQMCEQLMFGGDPTYGVKD